MSIGHELYLVRHGLAADPGPAYPDDSLRPLTKAGLERLAQEARGLSDLGVRFDAILTSPLVRARQTANALAAGIESSGPVVESAALCPGAAFQAVVQAVAEWRQAARIALVGHEPDMGRLAARLLGLRGSMPFKKGAVCRIDFDQWPPAEPGVLVWFVPPKMLRRLGSS